MKKSTKIVAVLGLLMGVISLGLAILWFGWQLAVILFLFAWANNINNGITNKN